MLAKNTKIVAEPVARAGAPVESRPSTLTRPAPLLLMQENDPARMFFGDA
jgi:hypothetical protein